MCESTINSLKNTTGIVALFSYEKKIGSSLLIASSAHDHSNVAWHHQAEPRAQSRFVLNEKFLRQHHAERGRIAWNFHFENLKSFSHCTCVSEILSAKSLQKGRVKDFTVCFYLRKTDIVSLIQTRWSFYDNVLLTVNDMNRFKCRIKTAIICHFIYFKRYEEKD
jgi:hypothetical protein